MGGDYRASDPIASMAGTTTSTSRVFLPSIALIEGVVQFSKRELCRHLKINHETYDKAVEGMSEAAGFTLLKKCFASIGIQFGSRKLVPRPDSEDPFWAGLHALGDWPVLLEAYDLPFTASWLDHFKEPGLALVEAHFSKGNGIDRMCKAHGHLGDLTPDLLDDMDQAEICSALTKRDLLAVGNRLAIRRTCLLLRLAEMEFAAQWPDLTKHGLFYEHIANYADADLWRGLLDYWDAHYENREAHIRAIQLSGAASEGADAGRELRLIAEATRAPSLKKLSYMPKALEKKFNLPKPQADRAPPADVALHLHLAMLGLREMLAWIANNYQDDYPALAGVFDRVRGSADSIAEQIPAWYTQTGITLPVR